MAGLWLGWLFEWLVGSLDGCLTGGLDGWLTAWLVVWTGKNQILVHRQYTMDRKVLLAGLPLEWQGTNRFDVRGEKSKNKCTSDLGWKAAGS